MHCFDLAAWITAQVPEGSTLGARAHRDALDLLDHVVLALKGIDREANLEAADAANALLRVRLRLLHHHGTLDERQLLFLSEQLDQVGRQVGGWLRSLG